MEGDVSFTFRQPRSYRNRCRCRIRRSSPPARGPRRSSPSGSLGIGSLNFLIGTDEDLTRKVQQYRKAVASLRRDRATRQQSLLLPRRWRWCWPTTAKPASMGFAAHASSAKACRPISFRRHRVFGPLDVAREPLPPSRLARADGQSFRRGSPLSAVIGDPVAAREAVSRFRDTGVDELMLVMQMGTVPHEIVMESIRTFADQVMPHFA